VDLHTSMSSMCSPNLQYFVNYFDRYFIKMQAVVFRNRFLGKVIRSENAEVLQQFWMEIRDSYGFGSENP
jgi:hypothetical protein